MQTCKNVANLKDETIEFNSFRQDVLEFTSWRLFNFVFGLIAICVFEQGNGFGSWILNGLKWYLV